MKVCVLRRDGEKADYYGIFHSVDSLVEKIFGKRNIQLEKEHRQYAEVVTFTVFSHEENLEKKILSFITEISRIHPAYAVRILS